jgi:hypothetical protein
MTYPNPTPDKKIVVEYLLPSASTNTINISVIDMQGKIRYIATQNIGKAGLRTSLPIDLSSVDLPSGTYLIKVQGENHTWTKKIIIH